MVELGEERAVIVFSLGAPRQRLMGWFLRDSGIPVELTDTLEQTLGLAQTRLYPVLVVNTTAPHAEIASAVAELRGADPVMRIVVLHGGRHAESDVDIPADICIHDVSDPDRLVEVVRAALADDVPAAEPHEAAEEVAGPSASQEARSRFDGAGRH
jgi:hypothetical protein